MKFKDLMNDEKFNEIQQLAECKIQPSGDYESLLNFAIENKYQFGKLKNNDNIPLYKTDEKEGEFSE
ncbi:36_t:CDS:2 [Funneliformis mosseae]|uniref:36_t:CDS:1 n=1 Tax=Funneliformis mosseae TaxID=27381 RepID=A0A9N9EQR4_FUNMO|nr:36_t:CDS:2 [Funneliformis mosseae]